MRKILLNLEISTKCRAACSMCPRKHVPTSVPLKSGRVIN